MGYIYLIYDSSNSLYKIGVTRRKDNTRIKKLQTGNPTELYIKIWYESEYPFRLETMLHNYYKNKKILNEWFDLTNEDISEFKLVCDKLMTYINALKSNPFFKKDLK